MTDGLATIIGETNELDICGIKIEISALKVREIPPFARALKPIIGPVAVILEKLDSKDGIDIGAIYGLLEDGDYLIQAVSIASRQPVDWVGDLEADEFLLLVMDVVRANADFFAQRLLPSIKIRMEQAVGSVSGSALSQQATQDGKNTP